MVVSNTDKVVNSDRRGHDGGVKPKRPTRKRRTAPAARLAILDAAEKRLAEVGPGGVRLQDVAADVGVSHPAILHHFGSREALIEAVVERAMTTLEEDLVRSFRAAGPVPPDAAGLFDRVFETLGKQGHARLLAWLALSGHEPRLSKTTQANWTRIIEITHALRLERTTARKQPSYEDTVFTILLAAIALFGQAIAGPATFQNAGLEHDRGAPARFRTWFAALLRDHLDRG